VAIGADGQWHTYYLHQNHEGSVTLLTDTSGNALERYRYDVFGQPAIYGPDNQVRQASLYSNRFLFIGREYNANFGFYEYRARAYHPSLGRFMSEDPKLFDAGDYNLFRYCHNDPLDLTDPMGLYGEGAGWTPEQWKHFDQAQKTAANQLSNSASKLDKAVEAGKDSKAFKSESKAFEKTYGKGTGTAENMSKVSGIMKGMVTALRDDGSKGYIANGMSAKEIMPFPGTDRNTMAVGFTPGKIINVNLEHRSFGSDSALRWAVGHA
jgi:RHS repeat-associated protein